MAEFDHKILHGKNSIMRLEHLLTMMDTEDEIFCISYDPSDKYIACGCGDGAIRVYNLNTGKMAFLLPNPKKYDDFLMPVTCLRWRPTSSEMKTKNILVTCAADGSLYHWHVTSGRLLHTIEPEDNNQLFCLDYSPDGRHLAVGCKDFSVRIIDEHTKTPVEILSGGMGVPGHSNRVFSVRYSTEDPNLLVSGSWDNTVLLWDVRQAKCAGSVFGPHVCGDSIDIREEGGTTNILVGSYSNDDNLYVIDMKKMELVTNINWFGEDFEKTEYVKPSCLYAAKYTVDGKYILAGGTSRNEVKVFKNNDPVDGYKIVASVTDLETACLTLDVSHDGNQFAFGCADGYLRIMIQWTGIRL